ncbi:MAG: dihydrolipoyl dehydrogenase [Candidatus Aminicenantales bacterium]
MVEKRQLVVIGGGPGGYAASLRAAQLGMKATLIEEDRIGGTCMNYGCIPTKFFLSQTKLLEEIKKNPRLEGVQERVNLDWPRVQQEKRAIIERLVRGVEFLLERSGVEVLKGKASLDSLKKIHFQGAQEERFLEAEHIILATGSRPADFPFLRADGKNIVTSREALELEKIPTTMIVVGAGAIGLELGSIFRRLGSDVTVLEIMPTILPGFDRQMVTRLERLLKKQGLRIRTEVRLEESHILAGEVLLKGTCLKTHTALEFRSEKVLIAVGRKPNSEVLGPAFAGLLDERGFVRADERLATPEEGLLAIGDLIGGKLLAHKAHHEGIVAAENVAGRKAAMDYQALPMAVFTEPEFASVGLTEEEAINQGLKYQTGLFSLQANGRAVTMESPEGLVKLLADPDGRLLGGHILAPNASELIGELALALRKGLSLEDMASTIHVHPTLSEAVMEAAMKTKGTAIHALNE